jgi:acetyl/propionyl-CoA carboxylase alpha subunit
MTPEVRAAICEAAVQAARAVRYEGAGTVEFIADAKDGLRADRIWFMEMNTRLQVEHPVTEAITGLDLVEWQLRVAAGEKLPLRQEAIPLRGHAIEARLYAENPDTGFLPSTGTLSHFRLDSGKVRVDSAVVEGGEVSPFYDPMIAKLIAHGPSREAAARLLANACASTEAWPVKTNAAFLARALRHPAFLAQALDTGFIETHLAELLGSPEPDEAVLRAAGLFRLGREPVEPPLLGFRLNAPPRIAVRLRAQGQIHDVHLTPDAASRLCAIQSADEIIIFAQGRAFAFTDCLADDAGDAGAESGGLVLAPMPGHILSVTVSNGEAVVKGAPLLVMEAMKMEMTLTAPCDGIVAELAVAPGARVAEGATLLHVEHST